MGSTQNYLRAIYRLSEDSGHTTTSELAEYLDVSNASASEAVQKLEEKNLICRAPYKGFALSPPGRKRAKKLVENSQIIKELLEEAGAENASEEAEKIGEIIENDTAEKIKQEIIEKNQFS